ncbi:hypothetical protein [Sinorhizobium medicae]|uniref:hypothetical protein n=1 Tax=Sinorhizobium medicae TaxID=110321 RepID=UPI0013041A49|nr:hypothetical protein [Sinorhizobium medicae]MDX0517710.1 hypothetical protein [Sinorhizobium medicae]MDX0566660.1 hypothetical protein [Sinorhizobium medicae]MDX0579285.1 hypothetical protein [Sinorhizobium medicae]MDX0728220.1 hypothetical protein [Sinorhizobium medicae]MDX0734398.1 hypothetical protein [Sinorhizobium medicae]
MEKNFDDALMDLIDQYMLAAEQNNGDLDELREDIISALELRLIALKEETNND